MPDITPLIQEQDEYLIGGEIRTWKGGVQKVVSPVRQAVLDVDGKVDHLDKVVLGYYPMMDSAAALEVLGAAKKAYDSGTGEWPMMRLEDRIMYIARFTEMMVARRELIVSLICMEICKTRLDAEAEFDRTVKYIQDTIESVKQTDRNDSRFTYAEGIIAQVRRSPLGIALCMGPYNYPLNETFTTLIPALIMGNVVIFKPPRLGVLLLRPLIECFQAFPAGVVNTIYGDGETVVKPIMADGSIDILNFIGSKRAAKAIIDYHPDKNRLLCVLGLQAKNAGIILPCADLDIAVAECVKGALKFNGQRCTALKMIFAHPRIAAEFLKRLCVAVDKLKVGMPWDGVSITPLADGEGAMSYLRGLIDDAKSFNASVVNANGDLGGGIGGTLMTPTVIAWVTPKMRLWREEQFGPVVPVTTTAQASFLMDVLDYHKGSGYGQQASVFGEDPANVSDFIDLLSNQVSRININCECQRGPDILPFTGRKDSATGTLSVSDAPKVMSIRRVTATKDTKGNRELIRAIVRSRSAKSLSTDWLF